MHKEQRAEFKEFLVDDDFSRDDSQAFSGEFLNDFGEFDQNILQQVRALIGDRQGLCDLGDVFERSNTSRIGQMKEAARLRNFTKIKDLAHAIKGSYASFGARRGTTQCQEIEDLCEHLTDEELLHRIEQIEVELHRVCVALRS